MNSVTYQGEVKSDITYKFLDSVRQRGDDVIGSKHDTSSRWQTNASILDHVGNND